MQKLYVSWAVGISQAFGTSAGDYLILNGVAFLVFQNFLWKKKTEMVEVEAIQNPVW